MRLSGPDRALGVVGGVPKKKGYVGDAVRQCSSLRITASGIP
jgi:hypothetical protein